MNVITLLRLAFSRLQIISFQSFRIYLADLFAMESKSSSYKQSSRSEKLLFMLVKFNSLDGA